MSCLILSSQTLKGTINHQLLPGRNIFWTPRAERTTAGLMSPGAFLVTPPSGRGLVIPIFFPWFFFFWWSLAPDLRFSLGRTSTSCRRSVKRSTIFSRLASIRQNLHEKRCRKLLAMQWHKTLFDESEDEDASKL